MSECAHHWLIGPPNGPTSSGVCKLCGAEGRFKNSADHVGEDGRVDLAPEGYESRSERLLAGSTAYRVPLMNQEHNALSEARRKERDDDE